MSTSIIDLQRDVFLHTLRETGQNERDKWRILVCDRDSRKILNNATKEDAVLNLNIINIEQIESKRETQPETWAIYLLSPLPHIIKCLEADLSRRRYHHCYIIWTSQLKKEDGRSIYDSQNPPRQIALMRELNIDFFPRESNLVSFRQDWSFQVLFNQHCDALIGKHLVALAQKIVSVCVALGEYPLVRFYKPEHKYHAAPLSEHLAHFVAEALKTYAQTPENNFPPPSSQPQQRPRAVLVITDRSMDLMAPLVHELTYQAMAMDLLPMQEKEDKVSYLNVIRRGQADQEEKLVELSEYDKIWVENRHLHMKDLLLKLSDDFRKFQAKNPQFADNDGQNISVNTIKDMLAGLPEFQEGKDAFSLHIDMAEKCAKLFQDRRLLDVTSVEQSLSTRWDEEGQPARNLADQIVRLFSDENVVPQDRLRVLMMYILYRGGIFDGDIQKLREHGELTFEDYKAIHNLEQLGALIVKTREGIYAGEKYESRAVFKHSPLKPKAGEEVSLSRYEPAIKHMLEQISSGELPEEKFPYHKYSRIDGKSAQVNVAQTSLRSAVNPTWAKGRSTVPRQRIIVFMAGGATYSEARACYEISEKTKEVYLASTHMFTPRTYLREVHHLGANRRQLNLEIDRGPTKLPQWVTEPPPEAMRPQQPQPQPQQHRPSSSRPPTESMQSMSLEASKQSNGSSRPASSQTATTPTPSGSFSTPMDLANSGKLKKEKKEKKGHLGGLFRKH